MSRKLLVFAAASIAFSGMLAWLASRLPDAVVDPLVVESPGSRAVHPISKEVPPPSDAKHGFVSKSFLSRDGKRYEYVVFVPHSYNGDRLLSTILFLHGSGGTKGGTHLPHTEALGTYLKERESTFPYLVVIPQAERWLWRDPENTAIALGALEQTQRDYRTDPQRVYLTGLSMGGTGTWDLAAAHSERWAAIVPICGRANDAAASAMKDLPCWAFHGSADEIVPVAESRKMVDALRKAGGNPKYTEYREGRHACWEEAYRTPQLWTWLVEQHRN